MRAIKVRIYPNNKQKDLIHKSFGAARFVFNKALALKINRYENFKENISWMEISKMVTLWRKTEELSWLKEPSRSLCEQALRHLETAYKNFFKGTASFPKFKKKHDKQAFSVDNSVKVVDNCIKFPKMGLIKCRGLRKFSGKIKTSTLSMNKSGQYFISWCIDDVEKLPQRSQNRRIGIDLGIVNFATMSNGTIIKNPKIHDKHSEKIKHFQRKQSKSKKSGQNFKKWKLKTAREWQKINNKKNDFLHKLSKQLVENQDVIVIEGLKVANMSKSAKGTIEAHGRNVKAKSGLNREILKLSWFEFKRQLTYKSEWYGSQLIEVNPKFTSQTCPECGFISKENRKTQADFSCVKCGYADNADMIASLNILEKGMGSVLKGCGGIGISQTCETISQTKLKAS